MNKLENVISTKKNIVESEIKGGGRDGKPDVAKRADPLKILLGSDKTKSLEAKTEKKNNYHKGHVKKARNVRIDYFDELKSQLPAEKTHKKPSPSHEKHEKQLDSVCEKGKKAEEKEDSRNHFFDPNKSFIEAIISEKGQGNVDSLVTKKVSSQPDQDELKLTRSDYRKIHINEILKGHAQKLQVNSSKSYVQVKEKPLQGINEILNKINSEAPNENSTLKSKDTPLQFKSKGSSCFEEKEVDRKKDLSVKSKQNEKLEGEKVISNHAMETKEKKAECDIATNKGHLEDVQDKVKKILSNKWIDYPQSRELESRLQGLWKNNLFFQDSQEDLKTAGASTDMTTSEAVKKLEKKIPYTDRITLLRHIDKIKKEDAETNPETKKKLEHTRMQVVNECIIGQALSLKNGEPATESMLKLKVSRTTELRELVNQAVKDHKIFCVFDNHWYIVRPVREELLNRGWLEVIPDRRLIPRRRPPPTGPVVEREKPATADRNWNSIEAILAAKEVFVTELEQTVAQTPSLKWPTEKPKFSLVPVQLSKKPSDIAVRVSETSFRIVPPNQEKKKNNFEIREFVAKCIAVMTKSSEKDKEKEKENEKHTKGKNNRGGDKKSKKTKEGGLFKSQKSKGRDRDRNREEVTEPTPLTRDLQTILDTVNDHKTTIHKALTQGRDEPAEEVYATDNMVVEPLKVKEEKTEESKNQEELPKVCFKESEAKTISKIIQSSNAKINFMWLSIKPAIHLKCFNYSPEIINKFQKTSFCTKIGLWNHLNNIQWYAHEVHFPAKSPRMYNTGEADDLQAFFQDFQLTACIGMLKWLADTFFDKGIKAVQTKKGKVPLRACEFAIKQCERYMKFKDNEDLSILDEPKVLQDEWNTFLQWFYTITNDHGKLQECSSAQLMVVYTKAVETLRLMKKHCPEIDIDGRLNMWIMKPYCASCGRGIFMTNNVYYIGQHSKYIVQKYIEKPLLIFNTKFDIRQWFMITKLTPLEIWMYKECYLRFCTQPFEIRNLHESVHLSNNSVQRKYVNRYDPTLTDQNMWDSTTFQMYLNTIGHPNAWNDVIYPGMRDAIVSIMLSAQDTFDGPRRNWFEVYGADFMLSSNVKDGPWLIEINENPAMDPSTKVTARLCPQMLRDVIKVVVDKRANKNASTGQWELVYRQNYSPSFATVDLDVKGRKIAKAPPTMKIEFTQCPNKDYEVVKSLSNVTESYTSVDKPEEPDPQNLDPLLVLQKEHEKFRQKCPIANAKEVIDRVLNEDGGKNLRSMKPPVDAPHSVPPKSGAAAPALRNSMPNSGLVLKKGEAENANLKEMNAAYGIPNGDPKLTKKARKSGEDLLNLNKFY